MAGLCTNVRQSVYQKALATAAPAPNQYKSTTTAVGRQALSSKPNAPGYSFGTSKRKTAKRGAGPAPNAYNAAGSAFGRQRGVSKRTSSAVAVFGTSKRNGSSRTRGAAPAPNAYNVADAYSAGRASRSNSKKPNAPAFSFGSSPRTGERAKGAGVPGPGNYGATVTAVGSQAVSTKPTSARTRFGTSRRDGSSHRSTTPAPNAYSATDAIGRQVLSTKPSAAGVKFSRARPRSARGARKDGPAPGSYSVPTTIGRRNSIAGIPTAPGFRMGTAKRAGLASRKAGQGPAPNAYSPRVTPRGDKRPPAYSFGTMKRSSTAPKSLAPGPGAYDNAKSSIGRQPDSRRATSSGVKFGTSRRSGMAKGSGPGAGQYSTPGGVGKQTDSRKPSAPTFSFGTSPRTPRDRRDAVPGPNAYSVRASDFTTVTDSKKTRPPTFKFGTSKREGMGSKSRTPGPQYSAEASIGRQVLSRHKSSGRIAFSQAKRFKRKTSSTPGPNQYNSNPGFLSRNKSTPAFTMGAR